MFLDQILKYLMALRCAGTDNGKEDFFFGLKVSLETFRKKTLDLLGPLFQSLYSHRPDLTQGLLAASQGQSQPVVVVMRKGNQTRVSHK